jgi:hypothetical protein
MIDTDIDTAPEAAIAVIMMFYLVAAVFNWFIPDTGVDHRVPSKNPFYLIREFSHCVALLWKDRLGQISLATTTLFWGAGATLQFIVIDWAATHLCYNLSRATYLQGVVAVGIALGAALAARFVALRNAVKVLPLGLLMGGIVIAMIYVTRLETAIILMTIVGACAGFFVVPMNALLQHRGHLLMGAGHSIAVQNFNENASILVLLGAYTLMIQGNLRIETIIVLFGLLVSGVMYALWRKHGHDQDRGEM